MIGIKNGDKYIGTDLKSVPTRLKTSEVVKHDKGTNRPKNLRHFSFASPLRLRVICLRLSTFNPDKQDTCINEVIFCLAPINGISTFTKLFL